MRKIIVLSLVLALVLSSGAFAAQVLLNRGFEDTTGHANNWTVTGANVEQYANMWMVPGTPAGLASTTWGLDLVNNYGISDATATQTVYLTPGQYTISASGWMRAFSGVGAGVSSGFIRLIVDGVTKETVTMTGVTGTWNDWTQLITQTYTVNVVSWARLRVSMHADGSGGWGQVAADQFRMDATLVPVPEPSSIFALATGLVGMAGFVVRRRK